MDEILDKFSQKCSSIKYYINYICCFWLTKEHLCSNDDYFKYSKIRGRYQMCIYHRIRNKSFLRIISCALMKTLLNSQGFDKTTLESLWITSACLMCDGSEDLQWRFAVKRQVRQLTCRARDHQGREWDKHQQQMPAIKPLQTSALTGGNR